MKTALMIALCLPLVTALNAQTIPVEPGVSLQLAEHRKAIISAINYQLAFDIPQSREEPIPARITISFNLTDTEQPLQLDFRESADKIRSLRSNDVPSAFQVQQEHLIIPSAELRMGENQIAIEFIAGEASLNRNPEFLYTLFVPDRARTAFPLFDQPNLKATYDLSLSIPAHWVAISNAPLMSVTQQGQRKELQFATSDLISSYLFSFVAGEFEQITRQVDGREISMLHRESDREKVLRNLDTVFNLHGAALGWLEQYTGIEYPFQKFDFALIPSFQYGGMEHVGAIQYRADSIFLDESPSQTQLLGRASLIAHETAHMWFGDLVTMDWFNDVWMKEVFANFMAAKVVNPSFPDIDHQLSFMLRHYPSAYAVDRTEGANPIRQELPNLNQAGSLYGAIIYNKAPIMMRQLELLIGEETFQEGLREYLSVYADGNATWPQLIEILDAKSAEDLASWSQVWVNTAGRPNFQYTSAGANSRIVQDDPAGLGRVWPQRFQLAVKSEDQTLVQTVDSLQRSTAVELNAVADDALLLNADGYGYGLFPEQLGKLSLWSELSDLEQGALLISLNENMLAGNGIEPAVYAVELMAIVVAEENQLLLNLAAAQLRAIYWSFLGEQERRIFTPDLELALWDAMLSAEESSRKKIYFDLFRNIALSPGQLDRIVAVWSEQDKVEGLNLSESDYIAMATDLAIKLPQRAEDIIDAQLVRIENPDRKRRFEWIRPALSADESVREAFFASLGDAENREIESWVLAGLRALHHPLRTATAEKHLLASLELLEEIQRTGDIFFPGRWLDASLGNYSTASAAQTVRDFLADRPGYNEQLRMKILQSADRLFRAESLRP